MKAKDLMIGDWVLDTCGNPIQVKELLEDGINGDWEGAECYGVEAIYDDIKPIQLTPEILEKNGFYFVKSSDRDTVWNGWWIYKGLELGVCCLDREGNWPCCINITDSNVPCEYVHQLQHALRLCGLNEVADNFKI